MCIFKEYIVDKYFVIAIILVTTLLTGCGLAGGSGVSISEFQTQVADKISTEPILLTINETNT